MVACDLIDKMFTPSTLQLYLHVIPNLRLYKMSLLQMVFKICLIIFMYEGVLTSDLSKRILLGDTDSIDGRLRQVEMKIQKLEAKSHTEIQTLSNTIHVLQQKGKFLYLNTLSRQLTFKKCLKIPKG